MVKRRIQVGLDRQLKEEIYVLNPEEKWELKHERNYSAFD